MVVFLPSLLFIFISLFSIQRYVRKTNLLHEEKGNIKTSYIGASATS